MKLGERPLKPAQAASSVPRIQVMLPYSENAPTVTSKSSIHQAIARAIAFKFLPPKEPIRGRNSSVNRTTVPEATIYEQCDAALWENEIWIAK
jgi:hypothetical protein